jgi:hypothetical protein
MTSRAALVFALLFFPTSSSAQTPVNYKVGFIGDTGAGSNFQNVLDLMVREGVDAVAHPGDLGYSSSSVTDWGDRVTNTLGATFPYFASVGNHDLGDWDTYRDMLEPRMTANGIPGHSLRHDSAG